MVKPIEDILIICKIQHIETNKMFINTLEDTLISCNKYKNTVGHKKYSNNLQILVIRFMFYNYKNTEHRTQQKENQITSQHHNFI